MNLAGCILFGISAIASYVVPTTGSIVDLAAANWGTSLGALCFLVGAVLIWPRRRVGYGESHERVRQSPRARRV